MTLLVTEWFQLLQITPILRFASSFISLKRQKLFIKFCIQEGHTKLTPSNSVYSHVWNVWFITRLVDIKPALYLLMSDKQQLLTMYNYACACNVVRFLSSFPRSLLWPPYVIGQAIIFLPCGFFFLSIFFFSSPNLSGRRLGVYHTSTHGVALVRN